MFNSPANKLLFGLLRAKPAYLFALLSLSLGETVLAIAGVLLLIPSIALLFDAYERIIWANYPSLLQYFGGIFDALAVRYPPIVLLVLGLLPFVLHNLVRYLAKVAQFKYVTDLVYLMQTRGVDSIGQIDLSYHRQTKPEDLLFKLDREINRSAIAIASIPKIIMLLATMTIFVGLLIYLSWQLTLVTAILASIFFVLNNSLDSWAKKTRLRSAVKIEESARQTVNFLTEIRWFKIAANESATSKAIARSIADKNRTIVTAQSVLAAKKALEETCSAVAVLVLAIAGYYLSPQSFSESAPVTILYIIILLRLLPSIALLDRIRRQFIQTRSSIETVANFLSKLDLLKSDSGSITFTKLQTGIEFREVTFAYPQHAQIVLDKISFEIPRGEVTASICSHLSGKSVIADLVMGFYDPIEGKILLDGIELRQYQLSSLRKAISIIESNTFLVDDTLAYNLTYGLNNVSQTDLIDAAKKAGIYQFIEQLPQGWATRIGKLRIALSEVQKLKISIARAFLRDPEILIICEPIENLDSQSVTEIVEILESLYRDRTTLIITQQLILTRKADRIVILNKGKIVEQGTQAQLLQQGGIYRRLYAKRFQTSQQSRQLNLARKIARKLARQTDDHLSSEIRSNFNELLNRFKSIEEGLLADEEEQNRILDESYQSAKNMLISLREYEQKIARDLSDL